MRVILAGGGTAGHINPALAVADTIKRHYPDSKILFVGTKAGMEANLVPKSGYKIEFIDVCGFKRKITPKNLISFFKAASALLKCRKIIGDFKPDIVIGTGGYVSGPVLKAAAAMKIPTLIHEQNVYAGMTSRMLGKCVNTVCISFEKSKSAFPKEKNVVLTGNPIRQELFDITREQARVKLGVGDAAYIVAFGGSLGAEKLNETMVNYIKNRKNKTCKILFATGDREYQRVLTMLNGVKKDGVEIVPYIYNMQEAMQAADLLVCRAGAITVSEITALGKASVLIPSPNVTDNHQYYNAKALADKGASVLLEEKELENKDFVSIVDKLIDNKEKLADMGKKAGKMGIKNASDLILKEIKKLV